MPGIPGGVTIFVDMVWIHIPGKVCIVSDNTSLGTWEIVTRITPARCSNTSEIILPGSYIAGIAKVICLVKHLGKGEVCLDPEAASPGNVQLGYFRMDMAGIHIAQLGVKLRRRDHRVSGDGFIGGNCERRTAPRTEAGCKNSQQENRPCDFPRCRHLSVSYRHSDQQHYYSIKKSQESLSWILDLFVYLSRVITPNYVLPPRILLT